MLHLQTPDTLAWCAFMRSEIFTDPAETVLCGTHVTSLDPLRGSTVVAADELYKFHLVRDLTFVGAGGNVSRSHKVCVNECECVYCHCTGHSRFSFLVALVCIHRNRKLLLKVLLKRAVYKQIYKKVGKHSKKKKVQPIG